MNEEQVSWKYVIEKKDGKKAVLSKSTGDSNRIKYVFETWNARLQSLLDSVDGLD